VTLNDPVYIEAAQALARRIVASSDNTMDRLRFAFETCLAREPHEAETKRLAALYDQALADFTADAEAAKKLATEPLGPASENANLAELAAWTVVSNVLLNLDEMLMKP
jgi:hypothetical protein